MAQESSEEDKSQKTEQPSQRKLEKALEQGRVVTSREVNSFFMLLFLTMSFIWILPFSFKSFGKYLFSIIEHSSDITSISTVLKKSIYKSLIALSPLFILVIFVSFFSAFVQRGHFVFSAEQITPNLSRLSPIAGFKKIFSLSSVVELLKGITKVGFIGFFIYLIIMSDISDLAIYPQLDVSSILAKIFNTIKNILISVSITYAAIAGIDYWYQFYKHFESLKMSKQELKDEYKETEGNPEVKSKQRSIRQSIAKQRMMSNVPKSTVVITNPEHYAVALSYEENSNKAPVVVAKGMDLIALKIREIANKNDVPIVENPPLARSLYKTTDIEQQIPSEHYAAVAQVISYVYYLRDKKSGKQ
jgi:flagellar biosynthesis protein FlhB